MYQKINAWSVVLAFIKTFCHSKASEKNASKSSLFKFSCTFNGAKSHVTRVTFILTSGNYICYCVVILCQILCWPRNALCKITRPFINSGWIALWHAFVTVKTWLLIACNTAFYAIIQGSYMFFHALTFAGSRGSCLNRRWEGRVFKRFPRDPAQWLFYRDAMDPRPVRPAIKSWVQSCIFF